MKPFTPSEEFEARTSLSYLNFCALIGFVFVVDGVAFSFGDKFGWRFLGMSFIVVGGFFAGRWLYWEYLRHKEKVRR